MKLKLAIIALALLLVLTAVIGLSLTARANRKHPLPAADGKILRGLRPTADAYAAHVDPLGRGTAVTKRLVW
jgi:hypothetical protein